MIEELKPILDVLMNEVFRNENVQDSLKAGAVQEFVKSLWSLKRNSSAKPSNNQIPLHNEIERATRASFLKMCRQVLKEANKDGDAKKFDQHMRALQKEQSAVWTEDYPEKTYQDRDYTNKLTVPSISFDKIHKLIPNFSGNIEDITTALRDSLEKHFIYEDYEVGQQPGLKTFNSEPERYVDIFRKAFSGHLQTRPQVNTAFRNFLLVQLVARDDVSDLKHLSETVGKLESALVEFVRRENQELAEKLKAYLDHHTRELKEFIEADGDKTRQQVKEAEEKIIRELHGPQRPGALKDHRMPHLPKPIAPFIFEKLNVGIYRKERGQNREVEQLKPQDAYWVEDYSAYHGQHYDVKPASNVLEAWLKESQTIHVLTGEPGSGKTTMLRKWGRALHAQHLQSERTSGDTRAVFYFPLRDMEKGDTPTNYRPDLVLDDQSFDVAPYYRGKKQAVWLFDGWDELDEDLREVWKGHIENAEGVRIVSCRTAVYSQLGKPFGKNNTQEQDVILWGLDQQARRDYLQRLFEAYRIKAGYERFSGVDDDWIDRLLKQLRSHNTLSQLAASPLLLRLIAENTSSADTPANPPEIDLPANRATFYERAFYGMLRRRPGIERYTARRLKQLLTRIARRTAHIPHPHLSEHRINQVSSWKPHQREQHHG